MKTLLLILVVLAGSFTINAQIKKNPVDSFTKAETERALLENLRQELEVKRLDVVVQKLEVKILHQRAELLAHKIQLMQEERRQKLSFLALPILAKNPLSNLRILNGTAIRLVKPQNYLAARRIDTVSVEVTLSIEGKVLSARAVSGNADLYAACEAAARKSTFNPVMANGKYVLLRGLVVYNFGQLSREINA